jgi:hypothetical protein
MSSRHSHHWGRASRISTRSSSVYRHSIKNPEPPVPRLRTTSGATMSSRVAMSMIARVQPNSHLNRLFKRELQTKVNLSFALEGQIWWSTKTDHMRLVREGQQLQNENRQLKIEGQRAGCQQENENDHATCKDV